MAHSFVTSFDHEIDSYRAYAEAFPKTCFLLIDTYNSIEGAKKAVIVGKELEKRGEKLMGVRLDSGDLAELSKHFGVVGPGMEVVPGANETLDQIAVFETTASKGITLNTQSRTDI